MNGYELGDDRQQWAQRFTDCLEAQLSFEAVVCEHMAVEIAMLASTVAPTADLLGALYEALLTRWGTGIAAGPQAAWRVQVAVDQHETIGLVLEGAYSRAHLAYEDYLRRHWRGIGAVGLGSDRFEPLLAKHIQALGEALLDELGVSALQARLVDLQQVWMTEARAHAQALAG